MVNTNFIGRDQDAFKYIERFGNKVENKSSLEIIQTFMQVYSKKYLQDKDALSTLLNKYKDTKHFKPKQNFYFDPNIILLDSNNVYTLTHGLNNGIIRAISDISINGYNVQFGFLNFNTVNDNQGVKAFMGFVSLDHRILENTPSPLIDQLYDIIFLANHDFIHGLSIDNESAGGMFNYGINNETQITDYEYMSLSFHYALFQDMFNKHPDLKVNLMEKIDTFATTLTQSSLGEEEKEYMFGVYIYFLRRILPIEEWPPSIQEQFLELAIIDDFPGGGDIQENNNYIKKTYTQLQEGKTIFYKHRK